MELSEPRHSRMVPSVAYLCTTKDVSTTFTSIHHSSSTKATIRPCPLSLRVRSLQVSALILQANNPLWTNQMNTSVSRHSFLHRSLFLHHCHLVNVQSARGTAAENSIGKSSPIHNQCFYAWKNGAGASQKAGSYQSTIRRSKSDHQNFCCQTTPALCVHESWNCKYIHSCSFLERCVMFVTIP